MPPPKLSGLFTWRHYPSILFILLQFVFLTYSIPLWLGLELNEFNVEVSNEPTAALLFVVQLRFFVCCVVCLLNDDYFLYSYTILKYINSEPHQSFSFFHFEVNLWNKTCFSFCFLFFFLCLFHTSLAQNIFLRKISISIFFKADCWDSSMSKLSLWVRYINIH